MPPIPSFEDTRAYAANRRLEAEVSARLSRSAPGRALEAGCGSTSHVALPPAFTLTGLDLSPSRLARHPGLTHRLCGDVEALPFRDGSFDVIVCWDVLEHLARPGDALAGMARALRAGGTLVLAFPHARSLKGLITRLTPYGFHAWFYRRVMGDGAAPGDFAQFPTRLRAEISPRRLERLARTLGLATDYVLTYEGPVQEALRARFRLADAAIGLASAASRVLSLGRHDMAHSDCHVLMTKAVR